MKILIIEDEPRAASSLEKIIMQLRPEAQLLGKCQSVSASVKLLRQDIEPELIFMDIQLADGLSFEIFKQVDIQAPVIFCTAFDEYSIEAFKKNGIDYILKPFSETDIAQALEKVERLGQFYRSKDSGSQSSQVLPDLNELVARLSTPSGKTSFLVFQQQKYMTIPTVDIAYFFVQHNATCIVCYDQKVYVLSQSLDQIASEVSEREFFRANRQYLVAFKAIKEVEPFFMRKLYVKLVIETKEKILVNKEKAPRLLAWLENR
ncbi:DNA-binding response regulator, LytR/AlgR family [Arachidicoccus rhizosphaerae]|uniref:DNA-binding response regulator, LytR/AlgR family n=1 Tax=Arachidicoccus rhizosphaerae TaxID=551991 RepID=A0A1H4B3Y8_9BACT|nr:LytTR family DNA-binding domain-containing protein [Arachidicoccus rhizosphaerae]SEA42905.1 DNA-binding response regulator, LytR/AlgR family [Arachidicoccus rhizosphaerae]